MTKKFTVYRSPFTMSFPFSVFDDYCQLVIDNLLKIVNCPSTSLRMVLG